MYSEILYLSTNQIEYLMNILREKGETLREEYDIVLKSKHCNIDRVNSIVDLMEQNNKVMHDLKKMKKGI